MLPAAVLLPGTTAVLLLVGVDKLSSWVPLVLSEACPVSEQLLFANAEVKAAVTRRCANGAPPDASGAGLFVTAAAAGGGRARAELLPADAAG